MYNVLTGRALCPYPQFEDNIGIGDDKRQERRNIVNTNDKGGGISPKEIRFAGFIRRMELPTHPTFFLTPNYLEFFVMPNVEQHGNEQ